MQQQPVFGTQVPLQPLHRVQHGARGSHQRDRGWPGNVRVQAVEHDGGQRAGQARGVRGQHPGRELQQHARPAQRRHVPRPRLQRAIE